MFPEGVRDLPVVDVLAELDAAIASGRDALLVAPPGAGKTTAAPLWLVDAPWLAGQRIVVLEPRRLATRAAAQRMATLLGERVGETVGYQTRDERHIGRSTRIEVVTEGVLTRRLQHDPSLPGTGLVVFDEIHERNLTTDLGLALVLDARANLRPDLRVLAMSATPDIRRLLTVLDDAAVLTSDGRPPSRRRPLAATGRRASASSRPRPPPSGERCATSPATCWCSCRASARSAACSSCWPAPCRAMSTFTSSPARCRWPSRTSRSLRRPRVAGGSCSRPTSPSRRSRSPGVRIVVDAGLARVPRFDQRTGMSRLTTVPTSRASADQRAGRAGRTEPGVAYRLWSKFEHATRRRPPRGRDHPGRSRRTRPRARRVGHAGRAAALRRPAARAHAAPRRSSCCNASARSTPRPGRPTVDGGCWHYRSTRLGADGRRGERVRAVAGVRDRRAGRRA